jgi:hypothetical protein
MQAAIPSCGARNALKDLFLMFFKKKFGRIFMRCKAKKTNDRRCHRRSLIGSSFCWQHQNNLVAKNIIPIIGNLDVIQGRWHDVQQKREKITKEVEEEKKETIADKAIEKTKVTKTTIEETIATEKTIEKKETTEKEETTIKEQRKESTEERIEIQKKASSNQEKAGEQASESDKLTISPPSSGTPNIQEVPPSANDKKIEEQKQLQPQAVPQRQELFHERLLCAFEKLKPYTVFFVFKDPVYHFTSSNSALAIMVKGEIPDKFEKVKETFVLKITENKPAAFVDNELKYAQQASNARKGPNVLKKVTCKFENNTKRGFILMDRLKGPDLSETFPYNEKDVNDALDVYYTLATTIGVRQNNAIGDHFMRDSKNDMYLLDYSLADENKFSESHMNEMSVLLQKDLLSSKSFKHATLTEKAEAFKNVTSGIITFWQTKYEQGAAAVRFFSSPWTDLFVAALDPRDNTFSKNFKTWFTLHWNRFKKM